LVITVFWLCSSATSSSSKVRISPASPHTGSDPLQAVAAKRKLQQAVSMGEALCLSFDDIQIGFKRLNAAIN
jgi:hypothetical protein